MSPYLVSQPNTQDARRINNPINLNIGGSRKFCGEPQFLGALKKFDFMNVVFELVIGINNYHKVSY